MKTMYHTIDAPGSLPGAFAFRPDWVDRLRDIESHGVVFHMYVGHDANVIEMRATDGSWNRVVSNNEFWPILQAFTAWEKRA